MESIVTRSLRLFCFMWWNTDEVTKCPITLNGMWKAAYIARHQTCLLRNKTQCQVVTLVGGKLPMLSFQSFDPWFGNTFLIHPHKLYYLGRNVLLLWNPKWRMVVLRLMSTFQRRRGACMKAGVTYKVLMRLTNCTLPTGGPKKGISDLVNWIEQKHKLLYRR